MDLKKIDNIYKIILDKVELDNKWVGLTPDVLKAFEWLSDEINEAKVEYLNKKQVYLEDELWDIIWCTLRLIELLDQKWHINKNNILNRLEKKYSQRTYWIKEWLCWDDIKNKQKVELKNEQELLDNL